MSRMYRKIYVAGHRGMVGSAIVRALQKQGGVHLILRDHKELDLLNQDAVKNFFEMEKPDQVYIAAAKVGGVYANNTYPAEFIYENLMVQLNVIHSAWLAGVKKLLFLGSSCIYPKSVSQPMQEEALMTGKLESTNEPYAVAKIAGIKVCESYNRQYGVDYRSIMPTNLFGPGDNYHPENSHVIPALIRRFHQAKLRNQSDVVIWGTGKPKREFLYVDDMAAACIFLMDLPKVIYDVHTKPMQSHINVGCGEDFSISELANLIAETVGYQGNIVFDSSKPDGVARKLMDSSKLKGLGWKPNVSLRAGLRITYDYFVTHPELIRVD